MCICAVEKYLLNIFNDYKLVAVDAFQDAKKRPIRTAILTTVLGGITLCAKYNPSETVFRQQLIASANELQLLGDKIQNPFANDHVERLVELRNSGRLRCLSLFLFSIMWTDNFDPDVDIYEAHCSYVSVGWTELPRKVVDIGFWNRWWLLNKAMENYDINPKEWNEELPKRLVDFDALK